MTERQKFYRSDKWQRFRAGIISDRTRPDGSIVCEECGKVIVKRYDIILHHVRELPDENIDAVTAFDPANIRLICFRCHNKAHDRWQGIAHGGNAPVPRARKNVYIVHGAPGSGKSTWVEQNAGPADLVVDLDKIWDAVKAKPAPWVKPPQLRNVVFDIRETLYDRIKTRDGGWGAAFVITSAPLLGDRERLAVRIGADKSIFIECDRDTCAEQIRARQGADAETTEQWLKYLDQWFASFQPDDEGSKIK